ncbi:helix-turn-helix transcriptional regulator [Acidaminobacter sp. JC074]|uniref:helix-turn-helix domain-containing protein n=1 Tax=Acidaminobacter sp. JC074 TaxID=2530199 RepID=UPI001F0CF481|nr:helix-turn-helix transcriptional regulator [Acidaminobacter sp. JC074]MCH4889408.1 helix-turn-helix transcriptional regulator [Acidaminobacter sp. JC074]
MNQIITIDSIKEFHDLLGYSEVNNNLVTLIDLNKVEPKDSLNNISVILNLYTVTFKENSLCEFKYGKEKVDFSKGTLVCTGPGQVFQLDALYKSKLQCYGWILCFHLDLIRNTHLEDIIDTYAYFSYDIHEALFLSDEEKNVIKKTVEHIREEYIEREIYCKQMVFAHLELLLYSVARFYDYQFRINHTSDEDVFVKFDRLLHQMLSDDLYVLGVPTVKSVAAKLGYSANYLSDLLKKKTGHTTSEHIQNHVLARSKDLLLDSRLSINEVSKKLGFEQQSNFSKFFKRKLGITPSAFRESNSKTFDYKIDDKDKLVV